MQWIVRAPRRPDVVAAARIEGRVLQLVRPALPVAAPDWRVHAPEVIAYPRITGVPAISVAAGEPTWHVLDPSAPAPAFIESMARTLATLQAIAPATAEATGAPVHVIYKPVRGERPLWDFPDGTLAGREVSAYAVSRATGWDLVPPTVLRDGPFGPGMCQLWVEVDEDVDLAELARGTHEDLRRLAVLDAVINNADRKGGHLLPRHDGRVQGIDQRRAAMVSTLVALRSADDPEPLVAVGRVVGEIAREKRRAACAGRPDEPRLTGYARRQRHVLRRGAHEVRRRAELCARTCARTGA